MFRRKKKDTSQEDITTDNGSFDKQGKSKFYRRFAEQELKGWSPIITGDAVVLYFLIVASVCVALGVPILLASLNVKEYTVRYDNADIMAGKTSEEQELMLMRSGGEGVPVLVNVTIAATMHPPVSSTNQ